MLPNSWPVIWRVLLGGTLGSLLRVIVMFFTGSLVLLVVVNLLGSAFLGWANGRKRFEGDNASAFWKVGFSGGFTTMSGVALYLANIESGVWQLVAVMLMMLIGVLVYRAAKFGASKWMR